MEEARRESEERFRRLSREFRILLDAIPDNLTFQDRELRVTWANQGAASGLGKEVGDLVGRHCYELWQGRNEPCPECPVQRCFSSGKPEHSVKGSPDGRTWELRAVPVQDDDGRIVGVVEVGRDITRIRNLEESVRRSEKMEAVGRLAGGIARDFDDLVATVTGYSEALQERIREGDPTWKEVEGIRQAGMRAASLTRRLLAFTGREALLVRVLDLNAVVSDLVKMLGRLMGDEVEVVPGISPAPLWVKADPGQLEQVILNLAVNSREAMPQGGRLTIGTAKARLEKGEAVRLGLGGAGEYAVLKTTDTGAGMSGEVKAHIFEPYFSTKEKRTGFGLATVYGIVQQSGGAIRVESEVGQGTAVEVFLPCVEPAGEAEREVEVRSAAPGTLETILVVEDEKMVRALVCEILRKYGYVVLEACGGDEAMEISRKHRGPIHLLLTDVVMPWMRGPDLAGNLAPDRPGMKILYMSGYTDDNSIRKGETALKSAFIQKPFGPEVLAKKVREVLDGDRKERPR